MSRYDGKPFLRLLDCYTLKAIGKLDAQHANGLRQVEPMFAKTFGTAGPWDRIVAEQMDFPDTFPSTIRKAWDRYQAWAKENKTEADPETFKFEFMERYFPDIVNG